MSSFYLLFLLLFILHALHGRYQSLQKHETDSAKSSTALTCFFYNFLIFQCRDMHLRLSLFSCISSIQCMLLPLKKIFSFISGNLYVVWPFRPVLSILHWFHLIRCHSDSFLFMWGWICEGVDLRCSPGYTLCPLCDFLAVPSVTVSCPPPQYTSSNVIVMIPGWQTGKTLPVVTFNATYSKNYNVTCFFWAQKKVLVFTSQNWEKSKLQFQLKKPCLPLH